MNKSLQSFIESQDIVFSVCSDFNWTADYEVLRENGLTIKQKVPLKMYLGVSKGSSSNKSIKITYNDFSSQTTTAPLQKIVRNGGQLKEFLNLESGLTLSFYSEFPRGIGLSFISCISSLLGQFMCHQDASVDPLQMAQKIESLLREKPVSLSNITSKFSDRSISVFNDQDGLTKTIEGKYTIDSLFDFLIIYSGKPASTEMSLDRLERLKDKQELGIYQNLSNLLGKRIKVGLELLSKGGYSQVNMQETMNVLKKFRYLWHIMEKTNPSLEKLKNEAIHVLNTQHPNLNYGLKFLNGSAIGGSLLLVIPKDGLRNLVSDFMSEINKLSGEHANIIHDSTVHGIGSGGVEVLPVKRSKTVQITFNTTENRVYIDSKRHSSKELPSQTQIIKLFKALKGKNKITNDELEKSSYSANRYDLESKILIPFKKLIKSETGKDFPIKCRGSQHRFSVEIGDIKSKFEIIFEKI
jgi:hypothetical protein